MVEFSIKDKVYELLTNHPHLRDSDERLIANIWKMQSEGVNSKMEFLYNLATGKLTNPESIRRMRQKIQEENPELRGTKYHARMKQTEKIKNNLGYAG